MNKLRTMLCVAGLLWFSQVGYSQDRIQPNVIVLDTTADQFWSQADKMGWQKNHVAIGDGRVTSINYYREIPVYAKDGVFLFDMTQMAATYARIKGYLRLALYDQNTQRITWLGMFDLTDVVPPQAKEPVYPKVVLDMSKNDFMDEADEFCWSVGTVSSGVNQVSSVNFQLQSPVYSSDGYLLFYLVAGNAEYVLRNGYLELTLYDGKQITKLGTIPVKKP